MTSPGGPRGRVLLAPESTTTPGLLAAALRAMADALEVLPLAAVDTDRLVPFPFGLEANAAREVMKRGLLVTAKIGRKRWAKHSAVLALVDVLHAEERAAKRGARAAKESDHETYVRLVEGRKR